LLLWGLLWEVLLQLSRTCNRRALLLPLRSPSRSDFISPFEEITIVTLEKPSAGHQQQINNYQVPAPPGAVLGLKTGTGQLHSFR